MKKKRKKKKIPGLMVLSLIVLIMALLVLLVIQFKTWKYLEKKEIIPMEVKDECSVLMNNILHNIKDEAGCENSCRAKCYTIEKEIYSSEFTLKEDSCNECKCFCR